MTDIIIPVKNLASAKLRLAGYLTPSERAELVISMLQDLLETLSRIDLGQIWVVTNDDSVCVISESYGALPIREKQASGYNSAVALGLSRVSNSSNVAVLPGDIPLATDSEIAALISPVSVTDKTIRLIPARDTRGTNGLFLSANNLIRPSFGVNSFVEFQLAAIGAGIEPEILNTEYLSHDIDTPDDLNDFAGIAVEGFTCDFLRKIGRSKSHCVLDKGVA